MIRAASLADAETLAALHAACFAKHWSAEEMAALLNTNAIAFLNDAAFILLRPAADEAEILTLATHPERQRQGLARALLEHAGTMLKAQGIARIFLEVSVENSAALALYTAAGFTEAGRRKAYYDQSIDALVLQKRL